MAISLALSGAADSVEDPVSLANNADWTAFLHWVATLSEEDYSTLHGLADDGEAENSNRLSDELLTALEVEPPEEPGALRAARGLAEALGPGDPDETATVTDGEEDEP